MDETLLYPPHVSVTGFFHATPQQAAQVCAALVRLVPEWARRGGLGTEVRGVVSTNDGHVILDVFAPGIADLAATLTAQADSLGISLRPKAVRHLSLGKCRSPLEQESIARLHADVPRGRCEFDLVVSRLVQRSDVLRLQREGQAHSFQELVRVSLSSGTRCAPRGRLHIRTSVIEGAPTPVRKRRCEGGVDVQAVTTGRASADVTPPKVGPSNASRGASSRRPSKVRRLK